MYHISFLLCAILLPALSTSGVQSLRDNGLPSFGRRQGRTSPLTDEHAMRAQSVLTQILQLYHRGTQWEIHAADACVGRVRSIVARNEQRMAQPLVVVLTADEGQFSQLVARKLPTATVVSFHTSVRAMRAHAGRHSKPKGDIIGGVFTATKLARLWSLTELFDILVISPGALDNLTAGRDSGVLDLILGRLISLSRWTLVADASAAATPAVSAARSATLSGARITQATLKRAVQAVRGRMTPYLQDPIRKVEPDPSVYARKKRKRWYQFEFGVRNLEVKTTEVPVRGTAGGLEHGRLFEIQVTSMLQQKRHDWDDRAWWKYYSLELSSADAKAVVGRLEIRDSVTIPRAALNLATLLGMGPPLSERIRLLADMLEVPAYPDVDTGNYVLCCGGKLQRIDKGHKNAFQNDKKRVQRAFSQFTGDSFLKIAVEEVANLATRCNTCVRCDRCTWMWAMTPCRDCLTCAKCIRSTAT